MLEVKRCFSINKNSSLELDKKLSKINFGDYSLKSALKEFGVIKEEEDSLEGSDLSRIDKILSQKDKVSMLEEFDKYLEDLITIHKKDYIKINWNSIKSIKQPVEDPLNGPNKIKALEEYENFEPNFIQKLIKFLGEKKKAELLVKVEEAEKVDSTLFENYKNLMDFCEFILNGDIDAYFMAIDEIKPFKDVLDYGSEMIFGCNEKNSIEIEFNVNSKKIVPDFLLSIDENEKIEKTKMKTTMYYDIVQDYVCSATLKIAKQTMEILPVEKVVIHAVDNLIDIDTKEDSDIVILSAVFDRTTMEKLNLKGIDCEFGIDNFICNTRQQKTTGFKSVKRITKY